MISELTEQIAQLNLAIKKAERNFKASPESEQYQALKTLRNMIEGVRIARLEELERIRIVDMDDKALESLLEDIL